MMETQAVDNFPEVPEAIGVLKQLNSDQSFPLFAGINLLGRVDPEHGPRYSTVAHNKEVSAEFVDLGDNRVHRCHAAIEVIPGTPPRFFARCEAQPDGKRPNGLLRATSKAVWEAYQRGSGGGVVNLTANASSEERWFQLFVGNVLCLSGAIALELALFDPSTDSNALLAAAGAGATQTVGDTSHHGPAGSRTPDTRSSSPSDHSAPRVGGGSGSGSRSGGRSRGNAKGVDADTMLERETDETDEEGGSSMIGDPLHASHASGHQAAHARTASRAAVAVEDKLHAAEGEGGGGGEDKQRCEDKEGEGEAAFDPNDMQTLVPGDMQTMVPLEDDDYASAGSDRESPHSHASEARGGGHATATTSHVLEPTQLAPPEPTQMMPASIADAGDDGVYPDVSRHSSSSPGRRNGRPQAGGGGGRHGGGGNSECSQLVVNRMMHDGNDMDTQLGAYDGISQLANEDRVALESVLQQSEEDARFDEPLPLSSTSATAHALTSPAPAVGAAASGSSNHVTFKASGGGGGGGAAAAPLSTPLIALPQSTPQPHAPNASLTSSASHTRPSQLSPIPHAPSQSSDSDGSQDVLIAAVVRDAIAKAERAVIASPGTRASPAATPASAPRVASKHAVVAPVVAPVALEVQEPETEPAHVVAKGKAAGRAGRSAGGGATALPTESSAVSKAAASNAAVKGKQATLRGKAQAATEASDVDNDEEEEAAVEPEAKRTGKGRASNASTGNTSSTPLASVPAPGSARAGRDRKAPSRFRESDDSDTASGVGGGGAGGDADGDEAMLTHGSSNHQGASKPGPGSHLKAAAGGATPAKVASKKGAKVEPAPEVVPDAMSGAKRPRSALSAQTTSTAAPVVAPTGVGGTRGRRGVVDADAVAAPVAVVEATSGGAEAGPAAKRKRVGASTSPPTTTAARAAGKGESKAEVESGDDADAGAGKGKEEASVPTAAAAAAEAGGKKRGGGRSSSLVAEAPQATTSKATAAAIAKAATLKVAAAVAESESRHFCLTGMEGKVKGELKKAIERLGGVVDDKVTAATTYLVAPAVRRTQNMLLAACTTPYFVTPAFVEASAAAKGWLNPHAYLPSVEVDDAILGGVDFAKAVQSRKRLPATPLSGHTFYVVSSTTGADELKEVIVVAGGTLREAATQVKRGDMIIGEALPDARPKKLAAELDALKSSGAACYNRPLPSVAIIKQALDAATKKKFEIKLW